MGLNKKQIQQFLENPTLLSANDTKKLSSLIDDYPYFQTARLLYTKGLKINDEEKFQEILNITATYAIDRTKLYQLINPQDNQNETEKITESPVEKTETIGTEPVISEETTQGNSTEEIPQNESIKEVIIESQKQIEEIEQKQIEENNDQLKEDIVSETIEETASKIEETATTEQVQVLEETPKESIEESSQDIETTPTIEQPIELQQSETCEQIIEECTEDELKQEPITSDTIEDASNDKTQEQIKVVEPIVEIKQNVEQPQQTQSEEQPITNQETEEKSIENPTVESKEESLADKILRKYAAQKAQENGINILDTVAKQVSAHSNKTEVAPKNDEQTQQIETQQPDEEENIRDDSLLDFSLPENDTFSSEIIQETKEEQPTIDFSELFNDNLSFIEEKQASEETASSEDFESIKQERNFLEEASLTNIVEGITEQTTTESSSNEQDLPSQKQIENIVESVGQVNEEALVQDIIKSVETKENPIEEDSHTNIVEEITEQTSIDNSSNEQDLPSQEQIENIVENIEEVNEKAPIQVETESIQTKETEEIPSIKEEEEVSIQNTFSKQDQEKINVYRETLLCAGKSPENIQKAIDYLGNPNENEKKKSIEDLIKAGLTVNGISQETFYTNLKTKETTEIHTEEVKTETTENIQTIVSKLESNTETSKKEVAKKEIEPIEIHDWYEQSEKKQNLHSIEIITQFIENNPQMPKMDHFMLGEYSKGEKITDLSEASIIDHECVTEQMAKLYAKQGVLGKAIKIYEKLILKYPEKSIYFANRISELKGH